MQSTTPAPDLRTALERVRDTLTNHSVPRSEYDRATDALWMAYRHGQAAPVTLGRGAVQ